MPAVRQHIIGLIVLSESILYSLTKKTTIECHGKDKQKIINLKKINDY